MAALKDIHCGRSDIFMLDPRLIVTDHGWNVRIHDEAWREHIDALKASIRPNGVREPLTVHMRGGEPHLSNGYCRMTAVHELIEEGVEVAAVPVRTERNASDVDRIVGLRTSNLGKPLTPLEDAEIFRRLDALGVPEAKIAERMGCSVQTVRNKLELAGADEAVKQMVAAKVVPATEVVRAQRVARAAGEDGEAVRAGLEARVDPASGKVRPKQPTARQLRALLDEVLSLIERGTNTNEIRDLIVEALDVEHAK